MKKLHGVDRGLQGLEIAGRTDKWIVEQLLGRDGKPNGPEQVARFLDVYVELLAEELPRRNGGLHPGVLGILEEAHKRPELVQALLTGNIEKGARLKLTRYGVNHFLGLGRLPMIRRSGMTSARMQDVGPRSIMGRSFRPKESS